MLRINNCGITGDLTISIQTSRNNERTKRLKFVRPSAILQATQLPKNAGIWFIQFSEEVWVQVDKQDGGEDGGEDGGNECSVCPKITVVFY